MRKKVVIGIVVFVMACVLFGAVVSGAADAERKGLGFAYKRAEYIFRAPRE